MKESEAARLLALAAAFDQRTVGPEDIGAWALALGDFKSSECAEAIRAHYTDSSDRIMPAHITRQVQQQRRAAASGHTRPAPPECSNPECGQPYRPSKVPAPGERCVRCHVPLTLRQAYTTHCPGGEECLCERKPCPPGAGLAMVAYRAYVTPSEEPAARPLM